MKMTEDALYEKYDKIYSDLKKVLKENYKELDHEDKEFIIWKLQDEFRFWE